MRGFFLEKYLWAGIGHFNFHIEIGEHWYLGEGCSGCLKYLKSILLHKYQILANACLFSQLHYSLRMVMHCFKLQPYTTSTSLIHLLCFDVLRWPILICYAGPYWWVMLANIDMICWSILMCYDGQYWLSKNKWFKKRLTYMFQRTLHNLRVVLSICKVIFFLGH